jgi:hypothetical protein
VGSHFVIEGISLVISFYTGMGHWRQRISLLKRTVGMEQPLTLEECYQLIDLSEAILSMGE